MTLLRLRTIVLATGTEIGKTYVASALLRAARQQGLTVTAAKPAMSGFSHNDLGACDAGQLAAACGDELTAENFSTYCFAAFEEPLAPNVTARQAGEALDYAKLLAFSRAAVEGDAAFSLVEGAGGVLSPLTDTHTNADLAADLGIPAILVSANYLGSVSHTLTALEACEKRGIHVAAIAFSQPTAGYGAPAEIAANLRAGRQRQRFYCPWRQRKTISRLIWSRRC